jgi:LysM repeat protein
MALTQAQIKAIQAAAKKGVANRAAIQKTKITTEQARQVSHTLNKRPGAHGSSFLQKDRNLLSKSELNTLGKTSKANAEKEKAIQKQRSFAKGEGKLPLKERVGTKAEYKQLGKEIQTRKQLIAYGKAARAAQAERAKNPVAKKAATPVKETAPVAKKATAPKKTTAPKPVAKKAAAAPKPKSIKAQVVAEPSAPKAPKASTAAVKKRTSPNTKPKADTKAPKLQTLEEAKAKAPTPKLGPEAGPSAPKAEAPKAAPKAAPKGKVKAPAVLKNAAKTSLGKDVAKVGKAVSNTKLGKTVKVAGKIANSKLVRRGGAVSLLLGEGPAALGKAENDFRRIQALENRIAVAKGQKPKYTRSGSKLNLLSSIKTDLGSYANTATFGIAGKSREARLQELKVMAAKAEKKASAKTPKSTTGKAPIVTTPGGQKVGGTPKATTSGSKYRVNAGDTLSGIAAKAGVSLKDLRAANPQITDPRKIYRNTGVVIPKSGKVPTGGYSKKVK